MLSRLSTRVTVVAGLSTGAGAAIVAAAFVPPLVLGTASGTTALPSTYKGIEVQPAISARAITVSVSKLFMSVSLMRLVMNRQKEAKLESCLCVVNVCEGWPKVAGP
jgi:hypothetical protein